MLRILRYAIVVLVDRHAANVIVSGEERALSFLFRSPMCKQRWAEESTTGILLASLLDVARREEDLPSACLIRYDAMQWGDDVFHGPAKERVYFVQTQLHFSVGAGSDSAQLFAEWLGFLAAERVTPRFRVLPGYDHLRDIVADDVAVGDDGDFDYDSWTRVVLLSMNVHILGMDRRDGLSDETFYPDELMAWLAALFHHECLETARGQELPKVVFV